MHLFRLIYTYIYIYIYIYIRRPLDRGATRLQGICLILHPPSYVSLHPCIYILLFLHPVSYMLDVVSWMQPSGWRSVAPGSSFYPPLSVVPGSWRSQPAAIYCIYCNMVHLQPLCSHMQPLCSHMR